MPPDNTQNGIQASSWGAGLTIQEQGLGYWYGGWLSNMSVPTWGSTPALISNFLTYNMISNTWTNSSGPDSVGRAEGVMLEIPASDGGVLVYFGGIQANASNPLGWSAQPMDTIMIYDIYNSRWYTQKATGDIPGDRTRFCAGAAWADDQSR
jgi:hypothetical protein